MTYSKSSKSESARARERMANAKVDNTHRKKWDVEEFEERRKEREAKEAAIPEEETAKQRRNREKKERDPLHMGLIVQRAHLRARDFDVDLTSRLGKTQMIAAGAGISERGGYYCSICDCTLADSQSYLTHINGRRHQRLLGMSMNVEKSTLQQVKDRFAMHKRRLSARPEKYDFGERVLQIEAAEEAEQYEKVQRKKQKVSISHSLHTLPSSSHTLPSRICVCVIYEILTCTCDVYIYVCTLRACSMVSHLCMRMRMSSRCVCLCVCVCDPTIFRGKRLWPKMRGRLQKRKMVSIQPWLLFWDSHHSEEQRDEDSIGGDDEEKTLSCTLSSRRDDEICVSACVLMGAMFARASGRGNDASIVIFLYR